MSIMVMPEVGQVAPNFIGNTDDNSEFELSNSKGNIVVLYFYPRANTPGCTKEACGFRDAYDEYLEKGAVVIGISPDSPESHQKFIDKFNLPFILLADTEKSVIQGFGAWGEKKNYGKTYMGLIRSTFVLDEDDTVIKVYPKVKPAEHAAEILELLH